MGDTKAFCYLWAVSGQLVVSVFFLPSVQGVLHGDGGRKAEEVLKNVANWKRAVWGTCKFLLIIFPYFERGTSAPDLVFFRYN